MLSIINSHVRDKKIKFQEEGHIYTIEGMKTNPISVTSLIHKFFGDFNADLIIDKMMASFKWKENKYYGRNREEIKSEWEKNRDESAAEGTKLHFDIETYLNTARKEGINMHVDIERFMNKMCVKNKSKEFGYFLDFWEKYQKANPSFQPYRTEWLIYDEDKNLAGSIDCVLSNGKDFVILDWKRSKEIKKENKYASGKYPFGKMPDCNFSHYTLQLNIYRHILEIKYNCNVIGMYLVVCHPVNESFLIYPVDKYDMGEVWDKLFV